MVMKAVLLTATLAVSAMGDVACGDNDLAIMQGMTDENAVTELAKMDGGMQGKCASCLMKNQENPMACTAYPDADDYVCDDDDTEMDICSDAPWGEPLVKDTVKINKCESDDDIGSDICSDEAWAYASDYVPKDDPTPEPTPSPTPAPTAKPKTETKFEVKVTCEKATEFDKTAFKAMLALESEVDASEVEIVKTEFVVTVGYKFAADTAITESAAKTAIATEWGVTEDKVSVTIASSRRLGEGRRLTVETSVTATLKTEDAAVADTAKTSAATTTGLASALGATVEVTAAPALDVEVETKVVSETAIVKPTASVLSNVAVAAAGAGATATMDDSTYTQALQVDTTKPWTILAPTPGPPTPVTPLDLSSLPTATCSDEVTENCTTSFTGSLSFEAEGLTPVQAAAGTQATLASILSHPIAQIAVTATKSRRLWLNEDLWIEEKDQTLLRGGKRRLAADTWTVAYEVHGALADHEDLKTKARNLNDDSIRQTLFADALKQQLIAVGASNAAASSVSVKSILSENVEAAPEEEADGAHALSGNFFLIFVAFMATSVLTQQTA